MWMIRTRLFVPIVQSLLHALYRPHRCAFRLMRHCWHGISDRRPLAGGDLGISDWGSLSVSRMLRGVRRPLRSQFAKNVLRRLAERRS
ncbi:hypothetical protein CRG98_015685 [Punica granatum]|uniref:Uncharacterized protein n=1 Tax=Punica granatum TaxID=22663 RepID=A0A2I0K5U1_PUNGR|nr:hypothetical protein CRG98_015685 [Punica granatum]